jgi:hypothetical protein
MRAATDSGSVQQRGNGFAHSGDCQCPTCGQPISVEKFAEIQGKQRTHDAEIERVAEARFVAKEAAIRKDATAAANAALADKLQKADQEKRAALQQAKTLKTGFDAELKRRLEVQTEVAAKDKDLAVNAATETHVKENLRLAALVNELTRALEKKSINTLGDELELDLFALLQSVPEFSGDTFERVGKGVAGPDIIQGIVQNGVRVGRVVFDAKNTKKWNGTWTRKLHQDAIALDAEQAVLVVAATAFPAGNHHGLLYRDSVMVVSASRLIPIVQMMRRHAIQSYTLKLSNQERGEKGDKLLLMLTSNRVASLWDRHREGVSTLLEIERSDATWQEKTRGRRTELINGLRTMVDQDFLSGVDRILAGGEVSP